MDLATLQAMKLPALRAKATELNISVFEGDRREINTYARAIQKHLASQESVDSGCRDLGILVIVFLALTIGIIIGLIKIAVWLGDQLINLCLDALDSNSKLKARRVKQSNRNLNGVKRLLISDHRKGATGIISTI